MSDVVKLGPTIPINKQLIDDQALVNACIFGEPFEDTETIEESVEQFNRILSNGGARMRSMWADLVR